MTSNISSPSRQQPAIAPLTGNAQTFGLFGYCYTDRLTLMPQLTSVFVQCGGWVLERRTISATAMDFRFDLQLNAILDLYGSLLALGLDLARTSHDTLTELCTCRKHSVDSLDPHQVLTLRLEISFLADVTLHSILMTGSGTA